MIIMTLANQQRSKGNVNKKLCAPGQSFWLEVKAGRDDEPCTTSDRNTIRPPDGQPKKDGFSVFRVYGALEPFVREDLATGRDRAGNKMRR